MKKWWLCLLLIMPSLSGAEVLTTAGPDAQILPSPMPEPALTSPRPANDASNARPTLVEKLKAQEAAAPRSVAPAWGNMIIGLASVLALILGMAWITKRLRARVPGFSEQMKIVETIALGPRERLCVVDVDGKRLLLGVTQHSINVLQASENENKKDESEAMFSEKIKKMLQNGTPNGR